MTQTERLILANLLSREGKTIPQIHAIIEMVEQRPVGDSEWKEVLEYISGKDLSDSQKDQRFN